jgi:hypothetical protein
LPPRCTAISSTTDAGPVVIALLSTRSGDGCHGHAAIALLLKRRYPELAIAPLLLSVQFMELVWVLLNFLGIERTTTDAVVRDVGDIPLAPVADTPKYGTYLYAQLPAVAFALELGFGVCCWWIFRGNRLLLAIVIAFNLALVGWAATRRTTATSV